MSWGLDLLELDEDADERSIKRAYAKRLRVTRPDDDPVAFQQLHEAYQAALAWSQRRAQWQEEEDDWVDPPSDARVPGDAHPIQPDALQAVLPQDRPLAQPDPADGDGPGHDPVLQVEGGGAFPMPHAPDAGGAVQPSLDAAPAVPPLDLEQVLPSLLEAAATQDPIDFGAWLKAMPALWSLRDKPRIESALIQGMLYEGHAMPAANFDRLASHFGWDEVGSTLDPYMASNCRWEMHRRWLLLPPHSKELAQFLTQPGQPISVTEARVRLRRLIHPFSSWASAWQACPPRQVRAMFQTLALLGVGDADEAPAPLRREQAGFWLDAAQKYRLNRPRMQIALLRGALTAATLAGMLCVMAVLGEFSTIFQGHDNSSDGYSLLNVAATVAGGTLAFFLLMPALRSFVLWHVADVDAPRRWRVLCLSLVPLLAVASVWLIHGFDQRVAGTAVAWMAMLLGISRWWLRGSYTVQFSGWMLVGLVPFMKLAGIALVIGEIAAAGGLLAWAVDAFARWRGR